MIDLHIHTTMSDGRLTPTEVVNEAAKNGTTIISITDHDTLSGVSEGEEAAKHAGIVLIPGIELSAKPYKEMHILGYYIDIQNQRLKKACDDFEQQLMNRADLIFDYLYRKGASITEESVYKQIPHKRIRRSHFANALIDAGYAVDYLDAFKKYGQTAEFQSFERPSLGMEECLSLVSDAGGTPVLAHPKSLDMNNEELELLLRKMIGLGLIGIECFYSYYTEEETDYYKSLADKYGLVATCGSDFHGGASSPGVSIGTGKGNLMFTDENMPNKLKRMSKNIKKESKWIL